MCARVPGAQTAARYARTQLYGYGKTLPKPDNLSWQQWIAQLVGRWSEGTGELPKRTALAKDPGINPRGFVAMQIRGHIGFHYERTPDPILPFVTHPETGICWHWLRKIAVRGNFKGRLLHPGRDSWRDYLATFRALKAHGRLWEVELPEEYPEPTAPEGVKEALDREMAEYEEYGVVTEEVDLPEDLNLLEEVPT
jgi:hypothetical protein